MALPLRRQIAILSASILLPVFAVIAWSSRATYVEEISHLENESRSMAAVIAVYLERGLDMAAVQTVIEAVPLPSGSVITVADDQGVVLARSRDPRRYVGRKFDEPIPARNVPQSQIREGLDGVERAYANVLAEAGPWVVSVGIPTAVARERVRPILERTFALSIGALLFAWLLEYFNVQQHVGAFVQTIERASRVAKGDFSPQPPMKMPSLEMEQLQNTFIHMVRKLHEAREALSAQVAEERRIREEVERLQRQVIRQERLAAIGVLVSGVAHELNNPLQAILGFAELLQMRKGLPPEIQGDLELIQKEGARASAIVQNLSRFGRQHATDATPIRLGEVVASVVELRQRKIEAGGVEFELDDRSTIPVNAIFTELQQVVLNFVINAEQALATSDGAKRIIIRTAEVGDRVRLEVHDNGPGVSRDHETKLFQPFFTTKEVGEGTGLGLSVSYGIIQAHGGTIGYRPAPGGGAVFYFELPTSSEDQARRTAS